jgi:hypothetical protein
MNAFVIWIFSKGEDYKFYPLIIVWLGDAFEWPKDRETDERAMMNMRTSRIDRRCQHWFPSKSYQPGITIHVGVLKTLSRVTNGQISALRSLTG